MCWENFELNCFNYLNHNFGEYATFERRGGSDSTVPDILVTTRNGNHFYIEAKMPAAQSKQFVLLPDFKDRIFTYSPRNRHQINPYMLEIINHMNNDFDNFSAAGTTGKNIIISNSQTIFSNCIITMYKEAGVRFIITGGYTILPLEKFQLYFNINATFRIKRSGSSSVGNKNMNDIIKYVENEYNIFSCRVGDGKLHIQSPDNLDKTRFIVGNYEYMISKKNTSYEVRKLSNTYNANVIFSINQREDVPGMSNSEFIKTLAE